MADGSVIIDTKLDQSGLQKGLAKLSGTVVKGLGAALAGASTLVTAGAGAAIKYGNEFESAFAGVKKTVDATDEQLSELRQGILDMSTEMPFAASDIASVAEAAGQLGIQTDNILSFTEVMSNLGVATNLSAEEAATSLAKFANIVQMPQDEFDKLGSVIVALGNNLATTEADIVSMGMRIAGTGSQVGLTESQIMALSGALSSVGLASEAGGSAISRVLSMMQLATEQEGDALEALSGVAGMTSTEFKQAFQQDATQALMAFLNGLNDAEAQGKSAIGVISELGEITELSAMDTIVVRDALLRAAGASDVMADALGIADKAWEENTALTNEAAQRYETFESKLTILGNTAKVLGEEIYTSMREPLGDLVDLATDIVRDMSDAFKEGGFTGLAEAAGNALATAATEISKYIPDVIELAVTIIESLASGLAENADVIVEALFDALTGALSHLTSVTAALGQLGVSLVGAIADGLVENADGILEGITEVAEQIIVGFTESMQTAIPRFLEIVSTLTPKIIESLSILLPELLKMAATIIPLVAEALIGSIDDIIRVGTEIVNALIDSISTDDGSLIDAAVEIVVGLAEAITDNIDDILLAAQELIMALLEGLTKPETIQKLFEAATIIVMALGEALLATVGSLLGFTSELCDNIAQWIIDFDWGALGMAIINGIADGLLQIDAIREAVDAFSEVWAIGYLEIEDFVRSVKEKWDEFIANLTDLWYKIYDGINNFKTQWSAFWKNVNETLTSKITELKTRLMEIPSKFAELIRGAKTWGSDLIQNFISGITAKFSALIQKVQSVAQTVADYLHFSVPEKGPLSDFDESAPDMMDLFAEGIEDNASKIEDEFNDALDFDVNSDKAIESIKEAIDDLELPDINGAGADGFDFDADAIVRAFAAAKGDANDIIQTFQNAIDHNKGFSTQESSNADYVVKGERITDDGTDDDEPPVELNATFNLNVDGEIVADAVIDRIDTKQAEKVELKKRGLSI